MRKKFILFVICLAVSIVLLYPYEGLTLAGFFRLLGGVFFASAAGVLNWQNLDDLYKDKVS